MKKLFFTFVLALIGFLGYSQQASQLIPTQGNNPKTFTPPNYLFVDVATNRIWPVLADSLRLKYINVQWLNDSVIVIADRRYVKLSGSYPNPSFINSLASSKVTGLSTVATSGDYNDLSNKPNLSVYETTSHANSTFYPITNPNGFISSYTETDPIWSGISANYRTKVQNDGLYKTIGYVPSNAEVISAIGYTPYNSINPNGYISSVPAQSFASLTGKPTTLSGYGITDAYPLTGNPSGFLTSQYVPAVNSGVTRPINSTTFTVSATKQAYVSYNVSISCTATIGSAASGSVALQYSTNAGSSWTTVGTVSNSNTVTLAVALNSVQVSSLQVSGYIPVNGLCRIVSTSSGVNTVITYLTGQETY